MNRLRIERGTYKYNLACVYYGIKRRTKDKTHTRYGGRGIKMCKDWLDDPYKFIYWSMLNGYRPNLQCDRIDNDGNYEPNNCRWVSSKVNNNNKSNNNVITYNNKSLTLSEWEVETGINQNTILYRLKRGWSIDDTLTKSIDDFKNYITYKGETRSVSEWAKVLNVSYSTLTSRLSRGWTLDKAFASTKLDNSEIIKYKNIKTTVAKLSKLLDIPKSTIRTGLDNGYDIHDIVNGRSKFNTIKIKDKWYDKRKVSKMLNISYSKINRMDSKNIYKLIKKNLCI